MIPSFRINLLPISLVAGGYLLVFLPPRFWGMNPFFLPAALLPGIVVLFLFYRRRGREQSALRVQMEELHRLVRDMVLDPGHPGETVAIPEQGGFSGLQDFNSLSSCLHDLREAMERQIEKRSLALQKAHHELQRQFGELRKTEERVRLIFRNCPMVLFALDGQGYFTFLEGRRGFMPPGLGKNRLPGTSAYDLFGGVSVVTGEGRDMTIAKAIDLTLAGGTVSGRIKIDETHFELHCHPVFGPNGTVAEVMGICFDITDRIRMEARYRELSQEFQGLLDGIPDSLVLLSPDIRVVWSNAGTSLLVGIEPKMLSGRLCSEIWCGDACESRNCPCRRSLVSGQSESARLKTPDGRIWGVKTFPLKGNDGSIRAIIRWCSDITDRARMEEDAMRSSHLAALGELAAGVAHEVNNPNGLILLNTATLMESWQDALPILEEYFQDQGDFLLGGIPFSRMRQEIPLLLSEMADGAKRIRRIVEDLKNFVRQDPDEYAEKVDLNLSVETAARLSASTVKKSTGNFSLCLAKELPPLLGNRQRLEQVIVNLLLNACQALDDPGQEIILRTRLDFASNNLVLEVVDQGVGIPPQAIPHITDPFFTTRREAGGTGLGLSVSARIVKEHGGSLHFDSRPGQGTTVTVYLPALPEDRNE